MVKYIIFSHKIILNINNKKTWKHLYDNDGFKFSNRNYKGEEVHSSKLTEKQVLEIKGLLKDGILKQREIGKIYNISYNVISDIKRKKNHGNT